MTAIQPECIALAESLPFNLGAAVQRIHAAGTASEDVIGDLDAAAWHIHREIARLKAAMAKASVTPAKSDLSDVCSAIRTMLDDADRRMAAAKPATAEAS